MRKILIALAFAGVAAVVALGARGHFGRSAAPEDGASGTARAGGHSTVVAGPGRGDASAALEGAFADDPAAPADARTDGSGGGAAGGARAIGAADSPPAAAVPGEGGASGGNDARRAAPGRAEDGAPAAERAGADGPAASAAGDPKAEAVLRRAAAAYDLVRSLRATFVQRLENPLLNATTTSRGTLYERRPGRFLMRFSQPAGDVIVSDGRTLWVYYPSVDSSQVIRAAGGAGAGGLDLQAQFLGDPLRRFAARLEGSETVGGRTATVLVLTPREPAQYRQLRVWVDERDGLVRRFEITDDSGAVRRFELSDLRVNPTLPDSLFHFEPPPGATIVDRG